MIISWENKVLLRIIDLSNVNNPNDNIEIVFEQKGQSVRYIIEKYTSPISNHFWKSLSSYYLNYLPYSKDVADDFGVSERIIKLGQYIGDELIGEDHQLTRIKNFIEKDGYKDLEVSIESARPDFFKELWELLILPDSNYVLSASVQSFNRHIICDPPTREYSELRFNLDNKERKLSILYLVSRPSDVEIPFSESTYVKNLLEAGQNAAIEYEIHQYVTWDELILRLSDSARPVHIFHYDGPIIVKNNACHIILENSQTESCLRPLDDLAAELVKYNTPLLSVDARRYCADGDSISSLEGLAMIAKSAHQHGLGNVLGLSGITHPFISYECFDGIYGEILKGFSLEQAVVEARKNFQSRFENNLVTINPKPFHSWALPVHYGLQSVFFFEGSQNEKAVSELQAAQPLHEIMFGFKTEMLPPLLEQVGDGQLWLLLHQLTDNEKGAGRTAMVIGDTGTGKTQLIHLASIYLAQRRKIDYAFYFDFLDRDYTRDDFYEMIASVLGLDPLQRQNTEHYLLEKRCCFVFENISHGKLQTPGVIENSLEAFIGKLISQGHIIICSDGLQSSYGNSIAKLMVKPISMFEQKVIASNILRQLQFNEAFKDESWQDLLPPLHGNPWLIKKVLPLLSFYSQSALNNHINDRFGDKQSARVVESFYEWQWAELPLISQKLLVLCAGAPGLLLEMLRVPFEQNEEFAPARSLFQVLDSEKRDFYDEINTWELRGFLVRFPHGRMVDSRCLAFLLGKFNSCFEMADQRKIKLHFNQLICEGIRILSQHVIKQPNPSISNNLILNRRHWVKNFEALWLEKDYRGFIEAVTAFDHLLQQFKLDYESKTWVLNLLEKYPLNDQSSRDERITWLILASNNINAVEAIKRTFIVDAINASRGWFDLLPSHIDTDELPLFHQVANFLELFYRTQAQWRDCIKVCEKAYAIYRHYETWKRVVVSLKSLIQYYMELNEYQKASFYESKLIEDIPYEQAPPGFKIQQHLDVLIMRLSRSDTRQAQSLINELRVAPEASKISNMLDGFQAEVNYLEANYLACLPYFVEHWSKALKSNLPAQIEQLKQRLLTIEQALGRERFDEEFDGMIPEETVKPRDYRSVLH